jgi:hypothetical protein
MSEAQDHRQRVERQDVVLSASHEAAGQRREERRVGTRARQTGPRWRYTDAVQAARRLSGGAAT